MRVQACRYLVVPLLALFVSLAPGCARDTGGPADGDPPAWDRGALHPGRSHRYSVQLVENGRVFDGWIAIRFGSGGDESQLAWELGGDGGIDSGVTEGGPGGLLLLGDEHVRSLLLATLLSPVLDMPLVLRYGWEDSVEDSEGVVTARVGEEVEVCGLIGRLVRWRLEDDGLALEVDAVVDPFRSLPLLVEVRSPSPGGYTLKVQLEEID